MKQLLLILCVCLTGCGEGVVSSPDETAISDYLKKTLDDPASYESVRFGKAFPLMRSDSANHAALALMKSNIQTERDKGYALIEGAGKDTTVLIGKTLVHAFRAKNKLGALVLDSAQFVVYKNGSVGLF